jgi:hypothetical protein
MSTLRRPSQLDNLLLLAINAFMVGSPVRLVMMASAFREQLSTASGRRLQYVYAGRGSSPYAELRRTAYSSGFP